MTTAGNKKILQICAIDLSVHALLKPLILSLQEKGYVVHSACSDTGKIEELRKQGLHIIEVPIDRKISPLSNLKSIIRMYKLIRREKYDIVHVHTPIAALLGRIAAKLARNTKIVYTAHGFYFHDEMPKSQYKFYYRLEKYAARFVTDWLLLQSKEDYELCVKDKFLPNDKVIHISNGVDVENKFNPDLFPMEERKRIRDGLGISQEDVAFMFIGRMVKEKGIFELVDAFHKLYEINDKAKLIMIGDIPQSERDQESYVELQKKIDHPAIKTLGFRQDIDSLLTASDAFVLPSYREGLPRSIIEAMAMGKPVIATDIRGCREEVFHGENGYLVPPKDAESLFRSMSLLAEDPERRTSYGRQSRLIAETEFNESTVIQKQIDLFDRL